MTTGYVVILATPPNNATSCGGFQRRIVFDGTGYWAFYLHEASLVRHWDYEYSADGTSWGGAAVQVFATDISVGAAGAATGGVDVKVYGAAIYAMVTGFTSPATYPVLFRKGTIAGAAIAWQPAIQLSTGGFCKIGGSIIRTTTGRLIVAYGDTVTGNLHDYYSTDDGGTWNTQVIGAISGASYTGGVVLVTLTSGKAMVLVKRWDDTLWYSIWDGAAWGALTQIATVITQAGFSAYAAVSVDDIVYLVYLNTSNEIRFKIYSGGLWDAGAGELVVAGLTSTSFPAISYDSTSERLFLFYAGKVANHIYYMIREEGSWGSEVDWLYEDVVGKGLVGNDRLCSLLDFSNYYPSVMYMTHYNAGNDSVKFYNEYVAPPPPPPTYAPTHRVEIYRRGSQLRFHDDSFSSGWVGAGITIDNTFDLAEIADGATVEKDITPTFDATDKYIYAYVPEANSRLRIYLRDLGAAWHLVLTCTEDVPGFRAAQITDSFTADRIRIVIGPEGTGSATIDYIVICDSMRIVPNCGYVTVSRKDEKESMSTAEFFAERITTARTGTYYDSTYDDITFLKTYTGTSLGRAHVKIWMSGYLSETLVKQFTGLISKVEFIHGKVHRQLNFSCLSYMIYAADSVRSISFEDEPTPASSAIKSIVQELISQKVFRVDRVSTISSHITNVYDHANMYDILQEIVNDPRINCHMQAGVDGDLFVFPYRSRKATMSILAKDVLKPGRRVDDYSPGVLVNSAIVLGDWSGHWPTRGISIFDIGPGVWSEVATNSDLVESDPAFFWQSEWGAALDVNVREPRVVGESALSIIQSGVGFQDGVGLARWFIPGLNARDWSQFNFYWKFDVKISKIRLALYSTFPGDYFWYAFGPIWSDVGWSPNRWGGDPYIETEVTVVPFGTKALNENGRPLYSRIGNPTWSRIRAIGIRWYYMEPLSYVNGVLDGAYFSGFRWKGTYADPSSIEDFGSCVQTFEGQYDSSEICRAVAESIVFARKDPAITLEDLKLQPRVDYRPCDEIRVQYSDIDTRLVTNEVDLVYDQAVLEVTMQLGPVPPDYAGYERVKESIERQKTKLTKIAAQRQREFFGWREAGRYGPI